MIPPQGFKFNEQTAINNSFQHSDGQDLNEELCIRANAEFDLLVKTLKKHKINVIVFDYPENVNNPDSVFPNNWFSTHQDGKVIIYPMFAANRRVEKRLDLFKFLENNFSFRVDEVKDFTSYEESKFFLEGTGSMVIDREHRIVYASISERTSLNLLNIFCEEMKFSLIYFSSFHNNKSSKSYIYHTNVMMSLGSKICLICLEAIQDTKQKQNVVESLNKTNKEIIEIDTYQLNNFAGNSLEVFNNDNEPLFVMSSSAMKSLSSIQKKKIEKHLKIIHSPLDTIEKYGGGSARCMMAEIFLPKAI